MNGRVAAPQNAALVSSFYCFRCGPRTRNRPPPYDAKPGVRKRIEMILAFLAGLALGITIGAIGVLAGLGWILCLLGNDELQKRREADHRAMHTTLRQ
jgi:hypothetical protein